MKAPIRETQFAPKEGGGENHERNLRGVRLLIVLREMLKPCYTKEREDRYAEGRIVQSP